MRSAVHVYWFTSQSSGKEVLHETIRYSDGTLSCSCPGWCKRTGTVAKTQDNPSGRSCKHVRIVQAGHGASLAIRHWLVGADTAPVAAPEGYTLPKPQRRFEFE
jgi:hypothetical protein